MMFRFRGDRVNIIRTQYDTKTKKAKQTVLGSLSKYKPQLSPNLRAACSADELAEIEQWIKSYVEIEKADQELNVRRLPERMASAAEWISNLPPEEAARVGTEILATWPYLGGAIKKTVGV